MHTISNFLDMYQKLYLKKDIIIIEYIYKQYNTDAIQKFLSKYKIL